MPSSSAFEPPGSPFLLPFLLASSWTWLALSLATIATLLRALPIFGLASFRLRRSTLSCGLPPPIALATSADCILAASSSCLAELQVDHSSPLAFERMQAPRKALALSGQISAVRRKCRSKSTSALQKLILQHNQHTGVLRSSMGLLSCLLDTDIAYTLERIPNLNSSFKTFNDGLIPQLDSANAKASAGRRCTVSFESQKQDIVLEQRSQEVEDGSICDVVTDSSSKSFYRGEPLYLEENYSRCEKLPAWAISLLKSVRTVMSSARSPNLCRLDRIPSFEKQFGWDKMLLTRLGWSWQLAEDTIGVSAEPLQGRHEREVVKVWSAQQKTVLKKLKVAGSTTSALASGWRNKSGCVGTKTGEISLWDVGEGTCVSRIRPFQTPVCALFMDSSKEMTFVGTTGGGDMALGLWDHRSFYEPMFRWERIPAPHIPMACLQVDGHDLSVAGAGALSMHDLRKPNSDSIASFRVDLATEFGVSDVPAMVTEEDPGFVWETEAALASEEDDEYWDNCGQPEMPEAAASKHSGSSSFVSRCVGLIRSMSSPSARQRPERIGD